MSSSQKEDHRNSKVQAGYHSQRLGRRHRDAFVVMASAAGPKLAAAGYDQHMLLPGEDQMVSRAYHHPAKNTGSPTKAVLFQDQSRAIDDSSHRHNIVTSGETAGAVESIPKNEYLFKATSDYVMPENSSHRRGEHPMRNGSRGSGNVGTAEIQPSCTPLPVSDPDINNSKKNLMSDSNGGSILQTLTSKDILCGRGKGFWKHAGNLSFTQFVKDNLCGYLQAKTRKEKSKVISDLLATLSSEGFRFVKGDSKSKDGPWHEISRHEAHAKTSHAVRDHLGVYPSSSSAPRNPRTGGYTKINTKALDLHKDTDPEGKKTMVLHLAMSTEFSGTQRSVPDVDSQTTNTREQAAKKRSLSEMPAVAEDRVPRKLKEPLQKQQRRNFFQGLQKERAHVRVVSVEERSSFNTGETGMRKAATDLCQEPVLHASCSDPLVSSVGSSRAPHARDIPCNIETSDQAILKDLIVLEKEKDLFNPGASSDIAREEANNIKTLDKSSLKPKDANHQTSDSMNGKEEEAVSFEALFKYSEFL